MGPQKTLGKLLQNRTKLSALDAGPGWFSEEKIQFLSYQEYFNQIEDLSLALANYGLKTASKVAIIGQSSKEWHLTDMAVMCSRAITVPIYPTLPIGEIEHLLEHSGVEIVVIETETMLIKLADKIQTNSNIRLIVCFQKISEANTHQMSVPVLTFSQLLQLGGKEKLSKGNYFSALIADSEPDDLATIIYTSGTTGEPKGAMLSHQALVQMLSNVFNHLNCGVSKNDRSLIFLPLAHVFGRSEALMALVFGWEFVFSRSMDKLFEDVNLAKPTILCAVPRVFEKIFHEINEKVKSSSQIEQIFFQKGLEISDQYFDLLDHDKSPPLSLILKREFFYQIIFKKINERLGGKIRYFVSGGAPLEIDILKFMRNCGLTILEGYGLTETAAPCVINPLYKQRIGTVGIPIGDVDIQFTDEQEIIIRSKSLFTGYYKNPDATNEALKEGWFYTGDIGEFDEKGYLKITDRKKDIIITASGKNVAPQKIEAMLKTRPHISHAIVIGDRKKYITALIAIEKSRFINLLANWGLGPEISSAELAAHPEVRGIIQREIDEINTLLAQFEMIKKFAIIPDEFSIQGGHLTPSLKVKRKHLNKVYQDRIDAMYKD